jgi:hypothetical protein
MWHIVGFRKIISFKIRIKKYTKLFEKIKLTIIWLWMTFWKNSYLFNEFVSSFGFFWHECTSLKLEWNESFKGPRVPKKAQITQERVEYKVFLFDEPLEGSKSLKIFKISLTFHFNKLSNLSKSVHTGENSQVLTVSNKKKIYIVLIVFLKWFVPVFVLFKSSHK